MIRERGKRIGAQTLVRRGSDGRRECSGMMDRAGVGDILFQGR
jgi:hypothetical protein